MKRLIVALCLTLSACAGAPAAPTTQATAAPLEVDYDINLPDTVLVQALRTQYPNGVQQSPIRSQLDWDYAKTYGAPNVYWGPSAPPKGTYTDVGIVVAPVEVAKEDTFSGSEWPVFADHPTQMYQWVGRFVYVPRQP